MTLMTQVFFNKIKVKDSVFITLSDCVTKKITKSKIKKIVLLRHLHHYRHLRHSRL
jgi:hypothetical protein